MILRELVIWYVLCIQTLDKNIFNYYI